MGRLAYADSQGDRQKSDLQLVIEEERFES